ncbi:MAG: HEAT repeat domain-containing protein, partial [Deltaproteobacteria bacterium]|nr:HEAT repeat domain-containing protein [Deltaproteobacteria bacterium]
MATPTLDPAILSGLGDRPSHEAVAQLNGLRQAVTLSADPEQLRAVAEAIPRAIAELPAEVGLAVQQVAMRLVSHRPVVPADIDRLEPRLRVEWLRVAVAVGDTAVLDALDDADLFAVVDQWPLDDVLDPRELIGRLCCAPTPRLRALGLDALETGISTLAMTAAEAFERVAALSDDADPRLRARAIGLMARGWMRALSPASSRRRDALVQTALVDDEPNVVASAIGATVNLGHSDWLRARVLETGGADTGQPQALAALGAVARDDDLDLVLGAALAEPLRLGPPARRFILEAHRHGVFLRAQHLPAVVALFDAHHAWTASQLVRVTHIVRRELVEHLALLPADDRRWVRRARVLALSIAPSAASVLVEQLRATVDPVIGAALVEAAGCSPSYTDEDPLLAWLEQLPEVVVPVLRVKGGPRSREHLRALVEDPFTERELRRLAMRSLWALETDRGVLLRQLSAQLGPHESGLLDQAHRVLRDRRIAAIVADAPWPDVEAHTIEPLKRLEVLCESDDITHLPEVEAGFRERVRSYVGSALAGDFTIKRVAMPQLEQLVFRYGRHLLAQGRCVRRFQSPDPQTGRDLVLRFACDWLHEEPAPPIMVALLETIGRHAPGGTTLRLIEPYWRHSHREVQRAAIEAIVEAGEGARGLELSLCRLIDHPEPRVLVQALGAVQVLEARWAEPAVLTALEHPAMAVKRAAAEALGEIASPRAVPALVEWLAHHDNANFRAALSNALDRAAADARVAVLVDALERETESRRITLLWRALDRHLTLAAAIRLARSDRESHRRLVDACLAREVTLADADRNTFAERLLKARLRTPAPAPDDPGRPLRVGGFSPDAAAALVRDSTPKLRGAVLETIGAALADWIAWLSTNDEAEPAAALSLVLDATKPRHREHIGRLLTLVEARLEMVEAGAAAGFIER